MCTLLIDGRAFIKYVFVLVVLNVRNILHVRLKNAFLTFFSLNLFLVFRFSELFISATNRSLLLYPHMPIGKVWIYRLQFVLCVGDVFVRLRSQILHGGSSASKAGNNKFLGTLLHQKLHQKPIIGRTE